MLFPRDLRQRNGGTKKTGSKKVSCLPLSVRNPTNLAIQHFPGPVNICAIKQKVKWLKSKIVCRLIHLVPGHEDACLEARNGELGSLGEAAGI